MLKSFRLFFFFILHLSSAAYAYDSLDQLLLQQRDVNDAIFPLKKRWGRSALEKALEKSEEHTSLRLLATNHEVCNINDSRENPRRWGAFNRFQSNHKILQNLDNGSKAISQTNRVRRYITLSEAQNFLKQARSKVYQAFKHLKGACWLRSTAMTAILAKTFPNLPVLKLWMMGTMKWQGELWSYHTVPIIPVYSPDKKKISWMALDTFFTKPLSVTTWTYQFVHVGKTCGKLELFISKSWRISPSWKSEIHELGTEERGPIYKLSKTLNIRP